MRNLASRKRLKRFAYGIVLSTIMVSSTTMTLATLTTEPSLIVNTGNLERCDITILESQNGSSDVVALMNTGEETIRIDNDKEVVAILAKPVRQASQIVKTATHINTRPITFSN
ncbi:MAG: hypothetical protein KAG28_02525 [Cocleimonas sp.]|nr:hypothetical protein [Cocleimonas sp.]